MARINLQISHSVKISKKLKLWLELASHVAADILPSSVKHTYLNLLVCGDQRIKSINRNFRDKDKVTDVLSFPVQNNLRHNKKLDWIQSGELSLGDLVISMPQAQRQAREFGLSMEEEMVHLFFHGYLHLLGYDHEVSVKEEKLMESLEAKLLDRFAKKRAS